MADETVELKDKVKSLETALRKERKRQEQVRVALGVPTWDGVEAALAKLGEDRKAAHATAKELAELKAGAKSPDAVTKENAELKAKLRARDHFDAFSEAGDAAGLSAKHRKALYKLSDLAPPESGDIKAESFKEFFASAKESYDWAFAQAASPADGKADDKKAPPKADTKIDTQRKPAPDGSGRGSSEGAKPDWQTKLAADVDAGSPHRGGDPFRIG